MPVARMQPDGLPFNVYERHGARVYRVWYKDPRPPRRIHFTLSCPAGDQLAVRAARREAIKRAADIQAGAPTANSFKHWGEAWLAAQRAKPVDSEGRRANSTLEENARELATLYSILGHMLVTELRPKHAYDYLEAGENNARPAKANKEIALASVVLSYCVRKGAIESNPFSRIKKNTVAKTDRLVTDAELALAVDVGRRIGGQALIVALGLKTAWLCVRRSVEVRAIKPDQITEDGVLWTGAKRKKGTAERSVLIEWSPELRATIDEALAARGDKVPAYIFGTQTGTQYTKGGWKITLSRLMDACEIEAAKKGLPFQRFSLQDCRPKGISEKEARGDDDTQDAALHTDRKMIDGVYDRRRVRRARPAA